jgi:hypothetical protein
MKGRTAAAASSYEIDFLIQKSNPSPCDDLTQLAHFLDLQETFRVQRQTAAIQVAQIRWWNERKSSSSIFFL